MERSPYTHHYHLAPDKPVFSHSHAGAVKGHTHEGQGITMRVIPPPTLSSYRDGSVRAFQSFQAWLKREPFHRRGGYCPDEDCVYCIAVRDIVQANKKLEADRAALCAGQPVFCGRCLELTQALLALNARSKKQEGAGTCVGIPCTFTQTRRRWDTTTCRTEASEEVWCGEKEGFRNFCQSHAARIETWWRKVMQGYGREVGHQIAVDALVALASAPYPKDFIDGLQKSLTQSAIADNAAAVKDFNRAARRELLKTIQESIDAS